MTSRQLTTDEIKKQFFDNINGIVRYWASHPEVPTAKEKVEGAIFSMLSMIDGCSGGSCGFKLIPNPHPDDKQYHIDEGTNYYPDFESDLKLNKDIDVNDYDICDGELHSQWHRT